MRNCDIAYKNLSTDYNRLLDLLDANFSVVVFDTIERDGDLTDYVKVCNAYKIGNVYDINGSYFAYWSREKIIELLTKCNVRFFDIEHVKI